MWKSKRAIRVATAVVVLIALTWGASVGTSAQAPQASTAGAPVKTPAPAPAAAPASGTAAIPNAAITTPDYVIGPDDLLSIVFWRDKDMSTDVAVRPDGRISLPLLNDIQAAGLTPEQLRVNVTEAATRFVEEPTVSVVVKQINSRKVYITGQVSKPGTYPLASTMNVVQLIALAGGLLEYADKEHILVVHIDRRPDGEPWSNEVNYLEIMKRLKLKQNIELKAGDTVLVP